MHQRKIDVGDRRVIKNMHDRTNTALARLRRSGDLTSAWGEDKKLRWTLAGR